MAYYPADLLPTQPEPMMSIDTTPDQGLNQLLDEAAALIRDIADRKDVAGRPQQVAHRIRCIAPTVLDAGILATLLSAAVHLEHVAKQTALRGAIRRQCQELAALREQAQIDLAVLLEGQAAT